MRWGDLRGSVLSAERRVYRRLPEADAGGSDPRRSRWWPHRTGDDRRPGHGAVLCGGCARQRLFLHQLDLSRFRQRHRAQRLWLLAAESRPGLLARSVQPQLHRTGQTTVSHADTGAGYARRHRPAVRAFGVMGGMMQPQGHLQVVLNMLEWDMDPQETLDAPRFCIESGAFHAVHMATANVALEEGISDATADAWRPPATSSTAARSAAITAPFSGVAKSSDATPTRASSGAAVTHALTAVPSQCCDGGEYEECNGRWR
eukprot:ctg_166.g90